MLTIPGVELDLDRSLVTLAGVPFPATVIIAQYGWLDCKKPCAGCEPHGGCPFGGAAFLKDPEWERGWEVFVPLENGAVIGVAMEGGGKFASKDQLVLTAHAPRMVPSNFSPDEKRTLELMHIMDRRFTMHCWRHGGARRSEFQWKDAQPDWAAEFIQRVARYEVEENIEGQPVRLVPLSQVFGKVVS